MIVLYASDQPQRYNQLQPKDRSSIGLRRFSKVCYGLEQQIRKMYSKRRKRFEVCVQQSQKIIWNVLSFMAPEGIYFQMRPKYVSSKYRLGPHLQFDKIRFTTYGAYIATCDHLMPQMSLEGFPNFFKNGNTILSNFDRFRNS